MGAGTTDIVCGRNCDYLHAVVLFLSMSSWSFGVNLSRYDRGAHIWYQGGSVHARVNHTYKDCNWGCVIIIYAWDVESMNPLSISLTGGSNICNGRYAYTEELLALERVAGDSEKICETFQCANFLPIDQWTPYLSRHPDREFAAFITRGLLHGFRIGFNRSAPLRPAPENFRSVYSNPVTVEKYVTEELALGRLVKSQAAGVRRNPIGIIPKPHQPGKFRLVVDLSAPASSSVNDGIPAPWCSMEYVSVDRAAKLVSQCGRGALMAKTDLQSAYRHVPVHPSDQHLLGIEWAGKVFVDRALPFGLRSAPKLFSAVADSLAWALQCEGVVNSIHYLDDFLFWGPPESTVCESALQKAIALSERLGLPVATQKTVSPTTVLTFLGIEIDSVAMVLRLPAEKLGRLRETLAQWERKRHATKHELQVLIGLLNHAAAVVRPGRTFTRQLIDTSKIPRRADHKVRLNVGCRADVAWWATFIQDWNGVGLFPNLPSGTTIVSDASGSWGCGGYNLGTNQWFQLQWPPSWAGVNIAVKELIPIVVSAALWGHEWAGSAVLFRSDNQAVIACLSSRSARDPHLSHLLRCLFFFEAHFEFEHRAKHIAGRENKAADALSRNNANEFLSLVPQAPHSAQQLPKALPDLLWDRSITWTSPRWKSLFASILLAASPKEQ